MPRRIAIVPRFNTKGKRDATGAFHPEATRWLEAVDASDRELVRFDNRAELPARRLEVERALAKLLEAGKRAGAVAFFCHGLWRQIQTGHTVATASRLARVLAPLLEVQDGAPVSIPLYACDAADGEPVRVGKRVERGPGGDGGFADELRDALLRREWDAHGPTLLGGWLDAHVTTGHTTRNPNVRRFYLLPLPHELAIGMVGGTALVSPEERALWSRWKHALQDEDAGDLRLRFSTMTRGQIVAELAAS